MDIINELIKQKNNMNEMISQENVEKYEEDEKEININDLLNTKISYKTKAMDIESVLNALKRGDYVLPKYQRKYVWEKHQASNLVLSLIKNIPIPPIYLYFDYDTGKYVVLDGQQRITTLFMYYNNIFYKGRNGREKIDFKNISRYLEEVEYHLDKKDHPIEKLSNSDIKKIDSKIKDIYKMIETKYNIIKTTFNLELENDEKDITFSNFDEKAKRILRRKDIDVVFVQCENENSDKAYSEIFKLLNSAGKELSSQEIRNGIYYNNILYDYIYKLNEKDIVWRKIYGQESLIFKDFEYLLRFLALDYFSNYNKDSKEFDINYKGTFSYSNIIDDYSKMFNRKSDDDKNFELDKNALEAIKKLKVFFNKFNDIHEDTEIKGKNLLILEAMFLAFSKLELLETDLRISYFSTVEKIKNNEVIRQYIQQSTSSKGNVKNRIEKIILLIQGMI